MSAGTGIRHSEFNPSSDAPVHFQQIWIIPDREGIAPRYAQKTFAASQKRGRLLLVGSSDGPRRAPSSSTRTSSSWRRFSRRARR
jgi:redox-sensitive bicupin YhaK (pirin superfamily)